MIGNFNNSIRKVTLGEGTTYISQVLVDGDTMSSGICFSNKIPLNKEFVGDEVIIEIVNFQGVMSYMRAVIELLKSWNIEGMENEYEELLRNIDMIIKK